MSALSQTNTNSNVEINVGPYDPGNSVYTGTLSVNGNLAVSGNVSYVTQLNVNDAFIQVAANNTGAVTSMGLIATKTSNTYAGLRWNTTVGAWQTSTSVNSDGSPVSAYANILSTAPGSNTQLIFNDAASFGANANLTFDKTTSTLTVTGIASATGNVIGGNLTTGGVVSSTGNVIGGNLTSLGSVSATGNINTGNFFMGNGYFLTGVAAASANAASLQGDTLSANVIYSSLTSFGTVSNISVSGNTTSGNLLTGGIVSSTGNVIGGNVNTGGQVSAIGNITGGNVAATTYTGTTVSVSGNVTAGNVNSGNVNSGNVNTNNLLGTGVTITSTGALNLSSTGNVVLTANTIINNVAEPQQASDAATKNYVDTVSQGLNVHDAAQAATPDTLANITGGTITYNNGTAGVGATLTTTGTFNLIDTVNVQTAGTRIMVKNEANAVTNGIYVWSNATVITRATDYDSVPEVESGDFVFVSAGNLYGNTGWVQTSTVTGIGTSGNNIVFTQFSGQGTYTAGTGLTLTGTAFNVNASQTQITAVGTLGSLSVSGNTTSGNLNTAGQVSATGNVTAGNLTTGGLITTTGNVVGGNVNTGGQISATGNITTSGYFVGDGSFISNAAFAGIQIVNGTSNVKIPNSSGNVEIAVAATPNVAVFTSSGVVVAGNVAAGNLVGTLIGNVTATGNVTGGNIQTSGNVSAAGNVNAGVNLTAAGLSLSGNVLSALNSTANITTTANVSAAYLLGNATFVTGLSASKIVNGTSEVNIGTSGGNANISIGGTSNVVVVSTAGVFVTGLVSASGNVIADNITTVGLVSASGNIDGGNLRTAGLITATGNVTGGNLITAALVQGATVSASGNAIGGNVNTAGIVSAAGNVLGANLISSLATGAAFNIIGSTPSAANTAGGAIAITAGNATSAGISSAGGAINLTAGAGSGDANVGTGGAVNITAGTGTGNAAGGLMTLRGGDSGVALGGTLSLSGGNADGIQSAGNAQLSGGSLTAGTDRQGGSLTLSAGAGTGAGTASQVVIRAPATTTSGVSVQSVSNVAVFNSTQANVVPTTISTSTTTGALIVGGGAGIAGNVYAGNFYTAGLVSAVGNITGGNLSAGTGTITVGNIVNSNANGVGNIGSSTTYFNTVFAKATSAQYADVAERYQADAFYYPGTVVVFGGENEVTQSTQSHDPRIAGVVSTNPAYLMNSGDDRKNSTQVALLGRVPCRVVGTIAKGDRLTSSDIPGVAGKYNIDQYEPGCIIGKALEDYDSESPGTIEVVIGRL